MKSFLTILPAYILSQFFRAFLAVIAPELASEMNLTPQDLGNIQVFWILGFVVMQFPVGLALDTIGPRKTVSSLMLVAVVGAVLFAQAHSALSLNVAMTLIGVGCSAVYMAALYIFGRTSPPEQFALFGSLLLGFGATGNLAAASPLAWAAANFGWRSAMLGIAALTAASAVALFLLIKDPPRVKSQNPVSFVKGLTTILGIRALWPLLPLTTISYAVVLSERGLWAGPYLSQVFHLAPVERGNALLIMAAAMSAGAFTYGPLDRFFGSYKWVVAGGSAVTAACFLFLGLANPSLTGATLSLAVLGAFGLTYGVLMAHARSFFPDHLLGRGITLMNVLFIGGAGLLQAVSGSYMNLLKETPPVEAYAKLHLLFGLALLVALIIYAFSTEKPRHSPAGH